VHDVQRLALGGWLVGVGEALADALAMRTAIGERGRLAVFFRNSMTPLRSAPSTYSMTMK
jgi:hypothetical protein